MQMLQQLNAYTWISALPPEILAEIFSYYVQYFRRNVELEDRSYYEWICTITHVCRYWRETALATPSLWNFIPITSPLPDPECVQAMVDRSKQKPLELKVIRRFARSRMVRNLLNSSSISSLDITIGNGRTYATVLKRVKPLPQLKYLRLAHGGIKLSGTSLCEPIPILAENTPFLQHIEFDGPRLASCSIVCRPTLRSLILRGIPDLVPSMWDFLHALREMPLLEEMTLNSVFPKSNISLIDDTPPSIEPIALPHLRSLQLFSEPVCTSAYFLRSISTPSALQELHLGKMYTRGPTMADFVILASVIAEKLKGDPDCSSSDNPSLRALCLTGKYSELDIRAWWRTRQLSGKWYCPADISLRLSIDGPMESIVNTVLDVFPLQDVRTCHVEYLPLPDIRFWQKLALRMPTLRGIRIDGPRAAALFSGFLGEQHLFSDVVTYPFPQLRTIMLKCVIPGVAQGAYIDGHHPDCQGTGVSPDGPSPWMILLKDALVARKGHDGEICKLMIKKCQNITLGDVRDLRAMVDVVLWDGQEIDVYGRRNGKLCESVDSELFELENKLENTRESIVDCTEEYDD